MALTVITKVKFIFGLNIILFIAVLGIFTYMKFTTSSSFMHTNYLVKPLFQIVLMVSIIFGHYLRVLKIANEHKPLVVEKDKKFIENVFIMIFLMAGFYCFMTLASLIAK